MTILSTSRFGLGTAEIRGSKKRPVHVCEIARRERERITKTMWESERAWCTPDFTSVRKNFEDTTIQKTLKTRITLQNIQDVSRVGGVPWSPVPRTSEGPGFESRSRPFHQAGFRGCSWQQGCHEASFKVRPRSSLEVVVSCLNQFSSHASYDVVHWRSKLVIMTSSYR